MFERWSWVSALFCVVFLGAVNGGQTAYGSEGLSFGGDFRYRHEMIDVEEKDMLNRQRIRARFNISSEVSQDLKVGLQLASGSDDPVSTNQTMTGGFSSKRVNIDLAFIDWRPRTFDGLNVSAGKIKNPYRTPGKTELMWDSDLRPEGIAAAWSRAVSGVEVFFNASYFWIEERKSDDDTVLLGGQAGLGYTAEAMNLVGGLGYFDYQNTKGWLPFYTPADGAGNSLDAAGAYLYDYNILELFAEATFPGLMNTTSVFLDYAGNVADGVDDGRGWLAGCSIGMCKAPGSYACRFTYREVEKDAVIGAFTDSDFSGGGTDGSGLELNIDYQLAPKFRTGITYYFNRAGIDDGIDYHRAQFDLNVKF